MSGLEGRVAVVTGASRGIGLAVAELFQSQGAHVVRLSRSLKDRVSERRVDISCDVTSDAQVEAAVNQVAAETGGPDIVVNNAGSFMWKALAETTAEDLAQQLAVNLVGPFRIVRAFLPFLVRKNRSHIVTIGSIADHVPLPGNAAYGPSKYGLRGLHQILAAEFAGGPVSLTLISPGPTDTPLWDPLEPDRREDLPDRRQMMAPEEVAQAVLFAVTRAPTTNIDLIRMNPA